MSGKLYTVLALFGVGLLVVLCPSLFYFSDTDDKNHPRRTKITALTEQFKEQSFDRNIRHVQNDVSRSHNRLADLRRKQPWTGQTPPQLAMQIRSEEEALNAAQSHLNALVTGREELMSQIRALTPVFSKMAWEETRDLFYKRQEQYAGTSVQYWKWNTMFDLLFGGMSREDNVISYVITALARLAGQLTFGTIIAMIDFTIRLPFWLTEYQLYTPEDFYTEQYSIDGARAPGEGKTKRRGAENVDEPAHTSNVEDDWEAQGGRAINSGGGWKSKFAAISFWLLAVLGGLTACVGLVAAIWSPLAALGVFAVFKARQERARGRNHPHSD